MNKYFLLLALFLSACVSDGEQNYNSESEGVVEVSEFDYYDSDDNGEKVAMEEVEIASLETLEGSEVAPAPASKVKKQSKPYKKQYRRELPQGNQLYVQAGAFSSKRNARRLVKRLSGLGNPQIYTSTEHHKAMHKVMFKVSNAREGRQLISKIKKTGHKAFMTKRK